MRILLLNPNASAHITARLAASARAVLAPGDTLIDVTNERGPAFVHDAATLAQADAQALEIADARSDEYDALLLGISLDGAISTLRPRVAPKPAIGMTEAAVAMAALTAPRIGLLTIGPQTLPLYRARLQALLPAARIGGLAAPDLPRAFSPASTGVDAALLPMLADAARAIEGDAVVLAGAVLCGYAAALQQAIGRPVFDGVDSAMRLLRAFKRQ